MEKNSRNMILKAAYRRFHDCGIDNTTISAIASDVFVKPQTVSYYFKNKHGLKEELILAIDRDFVRQAKLLTDDSEMILPVCLYLLWNKILKDPGFRAIQRDVFFSDALLEIDSAIDYSSSVLLMLYRFLNGGEPVDRNDSWIVKCNILNTFMLKGLFDSIDHSDSSLSYMYYAEMDIRMKAVILGIRDGKAADDIIKRVRCILSGVDVDLITEALPDFNQEERDDWDQDDEYQDDE